MGIALITGSTRGIGHEVARQLDAQGYLVIATGREESSASTAASKVSARAVGLPLDVADPGSIDAVARAIRDRFGALDVLVNNAAILLDEGVSILETSREVFEATCRANALGPLLMTQAVADLLRKSKAPRVVNVSSGAGQISSMTTYAPAYSISKAALNAITVMLAAALPGARVNCVDPGWVRTDMGGDSAPRDVTKGAETIVWLATLPAAGPTGGFFHDRKRIPW
ncbi:MAG TPA: SDR family NAD(P)-dependent oxidoreductase [Candidatus Eisenbacteria bacterium]|nr:SDR family NAD(P)-dependent oxidoreductase [Candidatus Eisenbacteria bacterium]